MNWNSTAESSVSICVHPWFRSYLFKGFGAAAGFTVAS
jgi:hypothetical protein